MCNRCHKQTVLCAQCSVRVRTFYWSKLVIIFRPSHSTICHAVYSSIRVTILLSSIASIGIKYKWRCFEYVSVVIWTFMCSTQYVDFWFSIRSSAFYGQTRSIETNECSFDYYVTLCRTVIRVIHLFPSSICSMSGHVAPFYIYAYGFIISITKHKQKLS